MTRHVVFGTGQVGRPLVEQLVDGASARGGRRQPQRPRRPARRRGRRRRTPPTRVHHPSCSRRRRRLLLPQRRQLRPLGRGVPAAAARRARRSREPPAPGWSSSTTCTRYGPTHGRALVETLPARPDLGQGRHPGGDDRRSCCDAHAAGQVEVAIGRASDYFGPGTTRSALGETVFGPALTGRTAQVMGDPDQPHSYSYTPDVAAGADHPRHPPGATGSVWHLPVAETRTTRQVIERVYALAGHRPQVLRRRRHDPAAVRPGQAADARVPAHPLPVHRPVGRRRHQVPHRVRRPATPLDDALAATLAWYRDARRPPPQMTDRHPPNGKEHRR